MRDGEVKKSRRVSGLGLSSGKDGVVTQMGKPVGRAGLGELGRSFWDMFGTSEKP